MHLGLIFKRECGNLDVGCQIARAPQAFEQIESDLQMARSWHHRSYIRSRKPTLHKIRRGTHGHRRLKNAAIGSDSNKSKQNRIDDTNLDLAFETAGPPLARGLMFRKSLDGSVEKKIYVGNDHRSEERSLIKVSASSSSSASLLKPTRSKPGFKTARCGRTL